MQQTTDGQLPRLARLAAAALAVIAATAALDLATVPAQASDGTRAGTARTAPACPASTRGASIRQLLRTAARHRRTARRLRRAAAALPRGPQRTRLIRKARRAEAAARRVRRLVRCKPPKAPAPAPSVPAPQPSPTPPPTATPAPPRPAPTATPSPTPTATPSPSPTATPTPAPPRPSLTITAVDSWSTTLSWDPVPGAATAEIVRDGRLVDRVPASAGSYRDRLLWPATAYDYLLRLLDAGGAELARHRAGAATPAQSRPVSRLYGAGSFVNMRIPADPTLDAGSRAIVAKAVTPYSGSANLANSSWWGVPLAYADASSRRYDVGCTIYFCDMRWAAHPIPSYAAPTLGSDHHLAVVDPERRTELDMWVAEQTADGWRAGTRWVTRADGTGSTCGDGGRCGGATAANFALMAGVVRPEELAQGRIDHALILTTPYTRAGVKACPATNTDGRYTDPAAVPLGARLQLDPSVDVDALPVPRWKKVIARALQEYGAYVGDTSGSLAVRAESTALRGYDAWAKAGVSSSAPSLKDLPWDRLRVLSFERC